MHKTIYSVLAAATLLCVVAACTTNTGYVAADNKAQAAFASQIAPNGSMVPFSFKQSDKFNLIESATVSDFDGGLLWTRNFNDSVSGISIECLTYCYDDFPVIETLTWLSNNGSDTTELISDLQALDFVFPLSGKPLLHYNTGGKSGIEEFSPQSCLLDTAQQPVKMGSYWGGFPTADYLPFFNLEYGTDENPAGVIVAVGWPTRWEVEFECLGDTAVRVSAGQLYTSMRLAPDERVRTPRVVLMFWKDNIDEAQNMWRQWMLRYNTPHPDGNAPTTMLEAASSPFFAEMFNAHDYDQIEFIDAYADNGIGLDYWWMDAGWYPNKGGTWQDLLGTWEADTLRYPHGLRKISDHAMSRGHRTMLWFEPERVTTDSWLWDNHPEWMLRVDHEGWPGFFNYGNKQARQWMLNHVDSILTAEGISLYRQDFAVMSGEYWDQQDRLSPGRTGISENQHAVGYLEYIDSLLARHPGMLMDICAAGGKRLELENLRRAVPMWRSDYAFEPIGVQGQTMGISPWIPYSGAGVNAVNEYSFRSNMSPSIVLNLDARRKDLEWSELRRLVSQWRNIGDDYKGNYYALTPYSIATDCWVGWMFYRPESSTGFIQAFRRKNAENSTQTLVLKGLDPKVDYTITNLDNGSTTTMTGRALMTDGITVTLPQPESSALLRIIH
ncbi:MAG: alpha-galactosidase [Muribaculum sp.]|nr:alpha-galactosidase [Muribaculaceae bacterium]MCM1080122.1 alpha-galactosidase [Muribaculum sp.]